MAPICALMRSSHLVWFKTMQTQALFVILTLNNINFEYKSKIVHTHRKYKQQILPYLSLREHNLTHRQAKCWGISYIKFVKNLEWNASWKIWIMCFVVLLRIIVDTDNRRSSYFRPCFGRSLFHRPHTPLHPYTHRSTRYDSG